MVSARMLLILAAVVCAMAQLPHSTGPEFGFLFDLWGEENGSEDQAPDQEEIDFIAVAENAMQSGDAEGPISFHVAGEVRVKHDPALVLNGNHAIVLIAGNDGSLTDLHPMTPDHWIGKVYVKDQDGKVIFVTDIREKNSAKSESFSIPANATALTPYSHCNLHGVWQGLTYDVATYRVNELEKFLEIAEGAMMSDDAYGPISFHVADTVPVKHDPAIVTEGKGIVVKVRGEKGSLTELHPMSENHWIGKIYVKDQNGKVVYVTDIRKKEKAQTDMFYIPAGAITLTPYEHCNLHGVWQGLTYDVRRLRNPSPAADTVVESLGLEKGAECKKCAECEKCETCAAPLSLLVRSKKFKTKCLRLPEKGNAKLAKCSQTDPRQSFHLRKRSDGSSFLALATGEEVCIKKNENKNKLCPCDTTGASDNVVSLKLAVKGNPLNAFVKLTSVDYDTGTRHCFATTAASTVVSTLCLNSALHLWLFQPIIV